MGECIFSRSPVPPAGFIVMWSGAINAIPIGWALCNGANGTPDLRGRFVLGAGGAYAVNAKGGAETVALTTAQLPSHTHGFNLYTNTAGAHSHTYQKGIPTGRANTPSGSMDVGTPTVITRRSADDTGHSHTILGCSIATTGSGQTHENRPPYYALCYIMKL